MSRARITRRNFLKGTATAGAAVTIPYLWTSQQSKAQDANSRLKLASIGVGGSRGRYSRGGKVGRAAARFADMMAVCDVDQLHNEEFNASFNGKLAMYQDYRDLFAKEKPDVVTVGTTDHWHVAVAIEALRAGCHVYCEKPLTLTIEEGKKICKVVKETGKTFQVGTQQRSEYGSKFLKAVAMVQGGFLGDNVRADVAIGGAPGGGPFDYTPVPDKLDWDMWVGPAPKVDYCDQRRKQFRWYLEYSGGKMTDWGAHHIDIAQWALGKSDTGPTEISGKGKLNGKPDDFDPVAFFAGQQVLPNSFNAATEFNIDLKFADGSLMTVNHRYRSEDGKTDFPNGILFSGSKGRIFVNRGKITGKPVEELSDADNKTINELIGNLYKGKQPGSHMGNFFNCIEDGGEPVSDVFTHHRTMTSCHMCNITLLLDRPLKWDPVKEVFVGDDVANALMSRPRRKGYEMKS